MNSPHQAHLNTKRTLNDRSYHTYLIRGGVKGDHNSGFYYSHKSLNDGIDKKSLPSPHHCLIRKTRNTIYIFSPQFIASRDKMKDICYCKGHHITRSIIIHYCKGEWFLVRNSVIIRKYKKINKNQTLF